MSSKIVKSLSLLSAVAVCLPMVACSSDSGRDSGTKSSAAQDSEYYPVVMDTPGGEVEIRAQPESIFVWAGRNAEMLDSMGVKMKAVNGESSREERDKFAPWQKESITSVMDDYALGEDPNFEKIATVDPDLIVSTPYQLGSPDRFERWNSIAPTIAHKTDGAVSDWQNEYMNLAKAVDKVDDANKVLDELTQKYRIEGVKIPRVSQSTYQYLYYYETDSEFYFLMVRLWNYLV